MKVVIADTKEGKSYQKELDANQSKPLFGMKIGQEFDGSLVGLTGYKMLIAGGTDKDGFPMRSDFIGQGRKRILLSEGPGFRPDAKGKRMRKTVRGNTVAVDIAQLNVKVKTYGSKKVTELLGIVEKPKEEKKAEKPEQKKEEKPKEEKPAEKQRKEPKAEAKAEKPVPEKFSLLSKETNIDERKQEKEPKAEVKAEKKPEKKG